MRHTTARASSWLQLATQLPYMHMFIYGPAHVTQWQAQNWYSELEFKMSDLLKLLCVADKESDVSTYGVSFDIWNSDVDKQLAV